MDTHICGFCLFVDFHGIQYVYAHPNRFTLASSKPYDEPQVIFATVEALMSRLSREGIIRLLQYRPRIISVVWDANICALTQLRQHIVTANVVCDENGYLHRLIIGQEQFVFGEKPGRGTCITQYVRAVSKSREVIVYVANDFEVPLWTTVQNEKTVECCINLGCRWFEIKSYDETRLICGMPRLTKNLRYRWVKGNIIPWDFHVERRLPGIRVPLAIRVLRTLGVWDQDPCSNALPCVAAVLCITYAVVLFVYFIYLHEFDTSIPVEYLVGVILGAPLLFLLSVCVWLGVTKCIRSCFNSDFVLPPEIPNDVTAHIQRSYRGDRSALRSNQISPSCVL